MLTLAIVTILLLSAGYITSLVMDYDDKKEEDYLAVWEEVLRKD